jgi:FtsP/CotA-like multicopper oxidase with cupredoxin domain
MSTRRNFLQRTAAWSAALLATGRETKAEVATSIPHDNTAQVHARGGYLGSASGSLSKLDTAPPPAATVPVITTEVGDMPFEMDGDVKVFRLTASVFRQQIAPQKWADVWGFNGSVPGPTIQVTQGDKVRVIYKNELPEATSIHWHGFEDAIANDGMPGISQSPIKPGESYTYNFTIKQEGTFFYHSHMAMQEMAGMLGAVVMHPRVPYRPHCHKDYLIHLQEFALLANQTVPDTMKMEYNWLLLNGKASPAATPLIVKQGERIRIRFVNMGMDHHPMHVHGHTFYTTGTEGGRIPETAWWPGNTVLVGVGQARDVEFVADNPGDWMLHCHLPHHMMNQMVTQVGPMTRPMKMEMSAKPAMRSGDVALADADMDASMMGMMQQQTDGPPRMSAQQKRQQEAFDTSDRSMMQQMQETAPNAENVPNYPQDALMEGPMMQMDALVNKPENLGLNADWSRFMQGMMTFVRVLPAEQYDRVIAAMKAANRPNDPSASLYGGAATSVVAKAGEVRR